MSVPEYCPVSAVDFHAFTDAFNKAYSDYFTPIAMIPDAFHALIQRDNLVLDSSVAALDGSTIIGTGLLGIRDNEGWIGGMGVIPGRRRQGIGREMMHYLIARARERSIERLYLEVIEQNTGARALYLELGFHFTRHLHILKRIPTTSPQPVSDYRITAAPAPEVLQWYDAFHDTRNCWQRSQPSLAGLVSQSQALSVSSPQGVVGYALGWFGPHEIRVVDLAVAPDLAHRRQGAAATLLSHIHWQHPHAFGSAYNFADDDALLPVFLEAGYVSDFRQLEMVLELTA